MFRPEITPTLSEPSSNSLKRTWDFTTTAVTEHTDRSKGYKLMNIVSLLVSFICIAIGLISNTWLAIAGAVLLQCCLFYMLHAARLYHERIFKDLNTAHQTETKQLRENDDETIRQLREEYEKIERQLKEEQAKNARPKIVGEIRDFAIFPIFSPGQHDDTIPENVVTGSDVTILVYLHNERPVPTAIKDLELSIEEDGETFVARYADNGEIYQERLGSERMYRLLNLNTIDNKKMLTRGEPLEGALRFFVEGRAPKETQESFSLTLTVTDAFGGEHLISIGGKPPHPSERLLSRLETKEKEMRERIRSELEYYITVGREIEEYKIKYPSLYESKKPEWRGRVHNYFQPLGRSYLKRFKDSGLDNDIDLLIEIQKEFAD